MAPRWQPVIVVALAVALPSCLLTCGPCPPGFPWMGLSRWEASNTAQACVAWSLLCGALALPAVPALQGHGGSATFFRRPIALQPYLAARPSLWERFAVGVLHFVLEEGAWRLVELSCGPSGLCPFSR